jgi:hypothetical protein
MNQLTPELAEKLLKIYAECLKYVEETSKNETISFNEKCRLIKINLYENSTTHGICNCALIRFKADLFCSDFSINYSGNDGYINPKMPKIKYAISSESFFEEVKAALDARLKVLAYFLF